MSNSPLVNYTKISPNSSNPRNKPITKITIHHVAGNLTVEQVGNIFATKERKASSNYGVDNHGRVGMYVEEKNRAWTSSSSENDNQAVTIEVANITGAPDWKVSDIALNKTIDLCVDICKRNNIKRLNFTGDKTGNLTMHKWFAATTCPGPYLESKFPYIANEVNKRLNSQPAVNPTPQPTQILYKVQTGAFSNKKNAEALAERLKKLGFETYIVSERKEGTAQTPAPEVRVGSKVKIIGSKYATGQTIPDWVKPKTYTVQQIAGDKALIKEIVSWVFTKDLMPI
jgi:N-acetyl-anhydromuramyl-L-alanine amidase AmpD/TusA-related sulfurtransferase